MNEPAPAGAFQPAASRRRFVVSLCLSALGFGLCCYLAVVGSVLNGATAPPGDPGFAALGRGTLGFLLFLLAVPLAVLPLLGALVALIGRRDEKRDGCWSGLSAVGQILALVSVVAPIAAWLFTWYLLGSVPPAGVSL